jgi:hypothetical protein
VPVAQDYIAEVAQYEKRVLSLRNQ